MNQQNFSLQPFIPVELDLIINGNIYHENNTLTIKYILQGELENIYIPSIKKHPIRQNELLL
ncbi:hypothetical protein RintRC_5248 [Richelia intracellularis]|nr:hypothetical protein RintRC_5248 [Richelia intracellularis]